MSDDSKASLFSEVAAYDSRNPFVTKFILASAIYNHDKLIELIYKPACKWGDIFNTSCLSSLLSGLLAALAITFLMFIGSLSGGYFFAFIKKKVSVRREAMIEDIDFSAKNRVTY